MRFPWVCRYILTYCNILSVSGSDSLIWSRNKFIRQPLVCMFGRDDKVEIIGKGHGDMMSSVKIITKGGFLMNEDD